MPSFLLNESIHTRLELTCLRNINLLYLIFHVSWPFIGWVVFQIEEPTYHNTINLNRPDWTCCQPWEQINGKRKMPVVGLSNIDPCLFCTSYSFLQRVDYAVVEASYKLFLSWAFFLPICIPLTDYVRILSHLVHLITTFSLFPVWLQEKKLFRDFTQAWRLIEELPFHYKSLYKSL